MGLPGVSEEKEKADFPIILGLPLTADFTAKIELPKGYTATIPDGVDLDRAYASYHSKYSLEDSIFHAERHFTLKTRQLSPDQKENYRQFQKAVSDDESRYIVINTGAEFIKQFPGSNELKEALADGLKKWNEQDYPGALDAMEHAVKLDPTSPQAWEGLGRLHMLMGHTDDSVKALRKAIGLEPKNPFVYETLFSTLLAAKRHEEAQQVLRDGLAENPQNIQIRRTLSDDLMNHGRYLDAAGVIEEGIKLDAKNPFLLTALGDAYAKAGESEKAVAAYEEAAAVAPTPFNWNNVSYAMAVANLKLPEAEHFARMAVEGIESDTSKISLDKLSNDDLRFMGNLSAYWDTLAWIYFRQDKFEDARKYAEASWMLRQDTVIADHLAQIEDKLGHTQAAASHYAFAAALGGGTTFKVGAHTVQMYVNPELSRIEDRLKTLLRKKSVQTVIDKKKLELSEIRAYSFPKSQLRDGNADFFVLIGPGPKVREVKFVSGSEDLKPAAKAIEGIHFNQRFPDDAPTRVVRRGILSCSKASPKCDFVLYTLDMVRSVE